MSSEPEADEVIEPSVTNPDETNDFVIPISGENNKTARSLTPEIPLSTSVFSRGGDGGAKNKADRPPLAPSDERSIRDEPEPVAREKQATHKPRRNGRREARRVVRIVSRVEVWSLVRVSALFYLCGWMIVTVAGLILWRVASSAGLIDNVEKFVAELIAEETVNIDGGAVFRASLIGGVVLVVASTAFTGLMAIVFNLISTVTGGIRMGVIEVETARPATTKSGGKAR